MVNTRDEIDRDLTRYREMRDFGRTPEPFGGSREKLWPHPLFVVQKHRASRLHYDLRIEIGGVLKSWAVPAGPSYDPTQKRFAFRTEDHPYEYAAFEGVIPPGNYGAGAMIVWDAGEWELVEPGDDPVAALDSGKLTFRLRGKKLFGEWALVKLQGRTSKENDWLLLKHRDQWANDEVDVTEVAPLSILSGRDLDDLGRGT